MKQKPLANQNILLTLLAEGNEHAFAQLFDYYKDRIYGTAMVFLKVPASAEEIVQDTFLKVWLKRSNFLHVKNFEAYLFTIAKNCIFDRLKKSAYHANQLPLSPYANMEVNDADYLLRKHESEVFLKSVIDALPPRQKTVYLLAKEHGMSHEAIAEHLGISDLTAKSHLTRAINTVRKKLKRYIAPILLLFPL